MRVLLFKYTSISCLSFLFLLVNSMTFDLCSLNLILLLTAHFEILLSSTLVMFSASRMESAFIIITTSSANAITFVCSVYLSVRRELYCTSMFQYPGPLHDPCGQPLVIVCMCVCMHACMYVCV